MASRKFWILALLTLVLLWVALPFLSIKIPFLNKEIVVKPKRVELGVFGREMVLNNDFKLGLDLSGGSHLVFELDTDKVAGEDREDAALAARNIIERRINFFGVSEPQVLMLNNNGVYRVSVDIPGSKNLQEAIDNIGRTAQLEFREYKTKEVKEGTSSATIPYFTETELNGRYLKKASLVFDQQSGKPQVGLVFNREGKEIFAKLSKNNVGKPLAIFLDNNLLTAPVVQQEIKNGEAVITGDFAVEEAKTLVNSLNAGALPLPIRLVEQKTVEAVLGQENVEKSVVAGALGLLCVALFMVGIYRREGLVAIFSLLLYAIYSVAVYKLFGVVLTLSGIAGFLLSIGMAVDANILIYERIKEEKKRLQDTQRAVRVGFFRALNAIKGANVNTLLVSFILFNPFNLNFLPQFGAVRGFALTLAIGVVLGLFTGVFITKNALWKVYRIEE